MTVFTVRLGEHNFIVLTYLLTYGNICDTHEVHDVDELKLRLTNVWRLAWGKVSSMMQCMSGTNVSGRVIMSKEGILST